MHKLTYTFLLFLILYNTKAQKVHQLTIDQAISRAIANSEDLQNLKLDEKIQYHKNEEVKGTALPQVSFSGQGSYYFSVPQIQFPSSDISVYQVLQKEGIKDANGNSITTDNATFGTQAVSFIAPLNFQYGIGLTQLLFQPDVFVAIKARETVLQYAQANTAVAEEKVKEAVKKAYYSVLIAQKQKIVLAETIKRLEKLSGEMSQMHKQGFIERLDVDKLEVSINNSKSGMNQLNNGIAITSTVLKNTLNVPISDSLVLTDELNVDILRANLLSHGADFKYENRKEIVLLDIARKLQDLDVQRNKMSNYPTVSAFANYQRQGQRNTTFNPDKPWFWFNTGLAGINLSLPLFDGFQRKNKIAQSKLALEKVDNSTNQVKRLIDMEMSIASSSLSNALLNLDVQERNVKLAESVFNTTKKKYEAGVGSSFELIQADTELQRAQGAYFQALYDGYVSKTAFDKAIGKL